jgi:hypothetical protein
LEKNGDGSFDGRVAECWNRDRARLRKSAGLAAWRPAAGGEFFERCRRPVYQLYPPARRTSLPGSEGWALARLEHDLPDLRAVAAGVPDVELEAELGRVAGARDAHLQALELVLA